MQIQSQIKNALSNIELALFKFCSQVCLNHDNLPTQCKLNKPISTIKNSIEYHNTWEKLNEMTQILVFSFLSISVLIGLYKHKITKHKLLTNTA